MVSHLLPDDMIDASKANTTAAAAQNTSTANCGMLYMDMQFRFRHLHADLYCPQHYSWTQVVPVTGNQINTEMIEVECTNWVNGLFMND